MVPLRVSQILTVPSSELVTIHLPSQWKATPVMLPVWPSKVMSGFGFVLLMSNSFTVWWPAAARNRLSGEMHSRFTCESGCWIVREQMPERASQNLFVPPGRVSARAHLPTSGGSTAPGRRGKGTMAGKFACIRIKAYRIVWS